MRIIADHARAAAFVIGDGQYPGNDKRGYVLRKIMRRAMVHGKRLGIDEPFIYRIAGTVVEMMKEAYPELVQARETIARVIKQEEDSFADTLGEGLKDFNDRARKLKAAGGQHAARRRGVLPLRHPRTAAGNHRRPGPGKRARGG